MKAAFQLRVQRYGWDKASVMYEKSWGNQIKPAQEMLMDIASLQPGENVLDIACGTGLISFQAAEKILPGGKLTGIDLSEKMIIEAQLKAESSGVYNTDFLKMNAEELMFDDTDFNVVLCSLGLMYFPDPQKALSEIYRVTIPGGRSVSSVWGERKNCGWSGIFDVIDSKVHSEVCPLFFYLGTLDCLARQHEIAGFRDIETIRVSTMLEYSNEKEALAAAFAGGPVALAYSKFDKETKQDAHEEYLRTIAEYRNGIGYNIPGEFVIVSGRK